jgi:hypothetical protein
MQLPSSMLSSLVTLFVTIGPIEIAVILCLIITYIAMRAADVLVEQTLSAGYVLQGLRYSSSLMVFSGEHRAFSMLAYVWRRTRDAGTGAACIEAKDQLFGSLSIRRSEPVRHPTYRPEKLADTGSL